MNSSESFQQAFCSERLFSIVEQTDNSLRWALTFGILYGVLSPTMNREVTVVNRRKTRETEILRKARLKKAMSQQQVASAAGVHVRQYQRLEYGERTMGCVNMRFGLTVCAVLEIDPFDLVLQISDIRYSNS